MKKWAVCGSRNAPATLQCYVNDILDRMVILVGRPAALAEGECSGYDIMSKNWANERCVTVKPFAAKRKQQGNAAGPIRNKKLLDEFQPDILIVFPGDKGTKNMVSQAIAAGVKIIRAPDPASVGY